MDLLRWFLVVMGVLWILWFIGGGPEGGRTDRPFLEPPPPLGSGETYGPSGAPSPTLGWFSFRQRGDEDAGDEATPSEGTSDEELFRQEVGFYARGEADATDEDEEYVVIAASRRNTEPANITDWRIRSAVTGNSVSIGEGAKLPFMGRVNNTAPIRLAPGDRALVITGRSPVGISFRLNQCTGYFEQFQDFQPRLPERCPYPREEIDTFSGFMPDACYDYVQSLPRCEAYISGAPLAVQQDSECMNWLNDTVNYNGCVNLHRADSDFYQREWRIYLGERTAKWRERRETLLLIDANGNTRDSITY